MKSNGRETITISSLPPLDVEIHGRTAHLTCPDCGTYVKVERSLAAYHERETWTHNAAGQLVSKRSNCPGTRQHYTFDIGPEQHATARTNAIRARRKAEAEAVRRAGHRTRPPGRVAVVHDAVRRPSALHGVAYPPVAPAVVQIAARNGEGRPASEAQTVGWSGLEPAFANKDQLWNTGRLTPRSQK